VPLAGFLGYGVGTFLAWKARMGKYEKTLEAEQSVEV